MSRRIFKYQVPIDDRVHEILMSKGAEVLHVAMQYDTSYLEDRPCFWAIDDSEVESEARRFTVVGTGHFLPNGAVHRGSILAPPFVWHLIELP